jgi:hypothetical protein
MSEPLNRLNNARRYEPVPSNVRQNLRLWATGAPEQVLSVFMPSYIVALEKGVEAERALLKEVLYVYDARIGWRTKDFEQPLVLRDYVEGTVVPVERLTPEEAAQKAARLLELRDVSGTN